MTRHLDSAEHISGSGLSWSDSLDGKRQPITTQPHLLYRAAFLGAIVIAVAVLLILGHTDAIDAWPARPVAVPPCRITANQVAHITVRIEHGELLAQCRVFEGRSP